MELPVAPFPAQVFKTKECGMDRLATAKAMVGVAMKLLANPIDGAPNAHIACVDDAIRTLKEWREAERKKSVSAISEGSRQ